MLAPHKVISASIGASDILYIDDFGMVHSISAATESISGDQNADPPILPSTRTYLTLPRSLKLEEQVKFVSMGFVHGFAVTISNKVYSWVPQPSFS